jgi:hypothetical protein
LEDQRKKLLEHIDDESLQANTSADDHEEKARAARKILDQCRAGQSLVLLNRFEKY